MESIGHVLLSTILCSKSESSQYLPPCAGVGFVQVLFRSIEYEGCPQPFTPLVIFHSPHVLTPPSTGHDMLDSVLDSKSASSQYLPPCAGVGFVQVLFRYII
jgi:hypothetical protein